MEFYKNCFPGKSFSTVTANRDQSFFTKAHICSKSSFTANTKMTSIAVLARDRFSVIKATAAAAVAARTASRLISFLTGFKGCCTTTTATAASGRAK